MNNRIKTLCIAMLCMIGLISTSLGQEATFFDQYPFLLSEYPNCDQEFFLEYDQGPFAFVYASDGRLFFQDGTFYCQDSDTSDCRALYDLTEITVESDNNTFIERIIKSSYIR